MKSTICQETCALIGVFQVAALFCGVWKWDTAKGKCSVSEKIVLRTYVSKVRVRAFQTRQ